MKIKAKSDIKQVLRYALLALAVELNEHHRRENFLLFMGPCDFRNLWAEPLASVEVIRKRLESEKSNFLAGPRKRFQEHKGRFFEIVSSLSVAFISYGDFASLLKADATPSDGSMGSEVYGNLVGGIVGELRRRGLA